MQIIQKIVVFFQFRIRLVLTFFVAIHILLAMVIGDTVILAPDEGGYAYTFKNLYGDSEDPNPQFSSGWLGAPKIFLFLVYLPAKVLTLFGLSDLLAVRLLSVILTSVVFYGVIFLASRNPSKKPDKIVALSLGVFFIPSTFLWTTLGLREAFIICALFMCFFGLIRYFSNQSFLNLIVITFGFYSLLSIKSYLWAGAILALMSFLPLTILRKIRIKNLFFIIISAMVFPVILFFATSSNHHALNFIINPDLSSATNRSGDSISVVNVDSETGVITSDTAHEGDKKVEIRGDYTAIALDNFIKSNPSSPQSRALKFLGIDKIVEEYIESKASATSNRGPIGDSKIEDNSGHMLKPGNLNDFVSWVKPSILFVFGHAPFMHNGESLFRAIASFESPLWWLFYSLVIFALFSNRKRNWLENPVLIYSIVLTIGYVIMSALTEVNFGISFRHRSILIIPMIFIVMASRVIFQNENQKNTPD